MGFTKPAAAVPMDHTVWNGTLLSDPQAAVDESKCVGHGLCEPAVHLRQTG